MIYWIITAKENKEDINNKLYALIIFVNIKDSAWILSCFILDDIIQEQEAII